MPVKSKDIFLMSAKGYHLILVDFCNQNPYKVSKMALATGQGGNLPLDPVENIYTKNIPQNIKIVKEETMVAAQPTPAQQPAQPTPPNDAKTNQPATQAQAQPPEVAPEQRITTPSFLYMRYMVPYDFWSNSILLLNDADQLVDKINLPSLKKDSQDGTLYVCETPTRQVKCCSGSGKNGDVNILVVCLPVGTTLDYSNEIKYLKEVYHVDLSTKQIIKRNEEFKVYFKVPKRITNPDEKTKLQSTSAPFKPDDNPSDTNNEATMDEEKKPDEQEKGSKNQKGKANKNNRNRRKGRNKGPTVERTDDQTRVPLTEPSDQQTASNPFDIPDTPNPDQPQPDNPTADPSQPAPNPDEKKDEAPPADQPAQGDNQEPKEEEDYDPEFDEESEGEERSEVFKFGKCLHRFKNPQNNRDPDNIFALIDRYVKFEKEFYNTSWMNDLAKDPTRPKYINKKDYDRMLSDLFVASLQDEVQSEDGKYQTEPRKFQRYTISDMTGFFELPEQTQKLYWDTPDVAKEFRRGLDKDSIDSHIFLTKIDDKTTVILSPNLYNYLAAFCNSSRDLFYFWCSYIEWHAIKKSKELNIAPHSRSLIIKGIYMFFTEVKKFEGHQYDYLSIYNTRNEKESRALADFHELIEIVLLMQPPEFDSMVRLFSENFFGPKNQFERGKFFDRIFSESGNTRLKISTPLYEYYISNKGITSEAKMKLITRVVSDRELRNRSQFLDVINDSFKSQELLLELIIRCLCSIDPYNTKIYENRHANGFFKALNDPVTSCIILNLHRASIYYKANPNEKPPNHILNATSKNNYFGAMYEALVHFCLSDLPNGNVPIDILANTSAYFSSTLMDNFLVIIDPGLQVKFEEQRKIVGDIKDVLRIIERPLRNYKEFLGSLRYFKDNELWFNDIKDNLNKFTITNLQQDERYKKLQVWKEDWTMLSNYLKFDKCKEELKEVVQSCNSAIMLFQKFSEYHRQTKAKFESFGQAEYRYSDYLNYFPRANHPSDEDKYRTCLLSFSISPSKIDHIIMNSKRFAGLRKVFHLTDAINALRGIEAVSVPNIPLIEHMTNINKILKDKQPTEITLSVLQAADNVGQVTSEKFVQTLPNELIQISKAPRTLAFIKETSNELFKMMRDDCNTEDADTVNKLDAINKYLKPIVITNNVKPEVKQQLPLIRSMREVLEVIANIDEKGRKEIREWMEEIEDANTHISHIFSKAQKGTGFSKSLIIQLMSRSLLIVKYSQITRLFEIEARYSPSGTKEETMDSVELSELINLVKILVTDKKASEADKDQMMLIDFAHLGDQLSIFVKHLNKIRQMGLMNTTFNKSVFNKLEQLSNKAMRLDVGDRAIPGEALLIEFRHSNNGLQMIEEVNTKLDSIIKKLDSDLNRAYSDWSVLNYFAGRKFYYLTLFLENNLTDYNERSENISIIIEAINVQELVDLIDNKVNYQISDDLEKRVNSVNEVMNGISKKVMEKLKVSSAEEDNILFRGSAGNGIKFASSKYSSRTVDKSDTEEDKVDFNEYEAILKILTQTSSDMLSLSQILYCSINMNPYELTVFLHRALSDPLKRMYFIVNVDALSYDLMIEMKITVESIFSKRVVNKNLLMFVNKRAYVEMLQQSDCFSSCNRDLLKTIYDVDLKSVIQKFSKQFQRNRVVTSELAGLGKTEYIKKQSANTTLVDIFLAGEVNEEVATLRVSNALSKLYNKSPLSICIKLDFIEDFNTHCNMVDYLLFYVCFLGRVPTERGCHIFKSNLQKVYVELGNTFSKELLATSSVLKLFASSECENFDKNIMTYLPLFSVNKVLYKSDPRSPEQVALKFLELIRVNQISNMRLDYTKTLTESDYHRIIAINFTGGKKVSDGKSRETYSQFQFWIKTLYLLATEMDEVASLNPSTMPVHSRALRTELALEIEDFCRTISTFTVDQARSSQEQMKNIISKYNGVKIEKDALDDYKKRFEKLKIWDCSGLIVPLMFKSSPTSNSNSLIVAINNINIFANREDAKRFNQRKELQRLIQDSKWYSDILDGKKLTYADMFIRILAEYTVGDKGKWVEAKNKIADFHSKEGFALSTDNFMKICLMLIKGKLNVPIVIMGESGCGKTYLTQFVSKCLLGEELKLLTLYSGITEVELLSFIKSCVDLAKQEKAKGKKVWVFFDEFNTTPLQSLICEIMIDRVCSVAPQEMNISEIPDNIVFVAACNPYRLRIKQTDVGLVPKGTDTILSHRVYPIPERILNYVWDFGQLSSEDEKKYITIMVKNAALFDKTNESTLEQFVNAVYNCHSYVRGVEERSGVSLRDVKRVIRVFKWFREKYMWIKSKGMFKEGADATEKIVLVKALISCVMICYGLRLNGREEYKTFIATLSKSLDKLSPFKKIKEDEIGNQLSGFIDHYVLEYIKSIRGAIPDEIAPNKPLKENLIGMLVAFDCKLPMIICGAPGTSKTLCTQILYQVLTDEVTTDVRFGLLSTFKSMFSMYYGGSQTSTAEGIKKVFQRGEKYLDNKGLDTPTVVFDEIGLAELSPHNPLKILHPLLEKENSQIAFLGMSNWTLDLSKMNRLIYIARPDLSEEDLIAIFRKSIDLVDKNKKDVKEVLSSLLTVLAKAYIEYRKWQRDNAEHKNFHGSRDMYATSKFFYSNIKRSSDLAVSSIRNIAKTVIERNFNGALYCFTQKKDDSNSISWDTVPGLAKEDCAQVFDKVKLTDLNSLESIDKICSEDQSKKKSSRELYLSSAAVFKRFFMENLRQHNDKIGSKPGQASSKQDINLVKVDVDENEFYEDIHTIDLFEQNIRDPSARFLLLKTEGDLVDTIILERLKKIFYKPKNAQAITPATPSNASQMREEEAHTYDDKIIDWRGVNTKENNIELLSTLKNYISLGYIVVMKNLDELYGSLYDLFNQKYTKMEGRDYCFLYYGESKQRVYVHPKFKCLVILAGQNEDKTQDIELTQPAPFLNRFEKFYVKIPNLLSTDHLKTLISLRKTSIELTGKKDTSIVGLTIDLVTSACLGIDTLSTSKYSASLHLIDLKALGKGQVSSNSLINILKMSTTNILINKYDMSPQDFTYLRQAHSHKDLYQVIDNLNPFECKFCIFTFSTPVVVKKMLDKYINAQSDSSQAVNEMMEEDPIEDQPRSQSPEYKYIDSEDLVRMGVERRLKFIKSLSQPIIIHMKAVSHLEMLPQIKASINDNSSISGVVIIIHLEREVSRNKMLTKNTGIDFWNDWDNLMLDKVEGTDFDGLKSALDKSMKQLIEDESNPIGKQIFVESTIFVLQQLIHDTKDANMQENLESMKKLLKSQTGQLIFNCIKQVLPMTEDFTNISCFELVRDRRRAQSTKVCVDIEYELSSKFRELAASEISAALSSINKHLESIASYAKGINSKDENIQKIFIAQLSQNLGTWTKESIARQNLQANSLIYLELPFWKEDYDNLKEVIKTATNSERYKDLCKRVKALENELDIENLNEIERDNKLDSVEKAHGLIIDSLASLDKAFIQVSKKFTEQKIQLKGGILKSFLYDLLNITFNDLENKNYYFFKTPSTFENLFFIIDNMKPDSDKIMDNFAIKRYINTGIYIFTCYSNEMKILSDLILDHKADLKTFSGSIIDTAKIAGLNYKFKTPVLLKTITMIKLNFEDSSSPFNTILAKLRQLSNQSERSSNISTSLNYLLILRNPFSLGFSAQKEAKSIMEECTSKLKTFGEKVYFQEIKTRMPEVIRLIDLDGNIDERANRVTLACEYMYLSFNDCNLEFFSSSLSNEFFDKLKGQELDRMCNSAVAAIMNLAEYDWADNLSTLAKFKNIEQTLCTDSKICRIFEHLAQCKETRVQSLFVILVDRLVVQLQDNKDFKATDEHIPDMLDRAFGMFRPKKGIADIRNICCFVVLRACLNKNFIEHLGDFRYHERLNDILDACPPLDELITNPEHYFRIYFLQSLQLYDPDYANKASKYSLLSGYLTSIVDKSESKMITFFSDDMINHYNRIANAFDVKSNEEIKKILEERVFERKEMTRYLFACVLINKFINDVREEDARMMMAVKENCLAKLPHLGLNGSQMELCKIIIKAEAFNFTEFMQESERDREFGSRLRKLFYQYLAIYACFDTQLGYSLQPYMTQQQQPVLSHIGFKSNIVATREVSNLTQLFNQVLYVRLAEYQVNLPFVEGQAQIHLGMYRCSCGYGYGLGNCGQPQEVYNCGWCGQQIGGTGHRLVQRAGHHNIPSFATLSNYINQEYDRANTRYYGHKILESNDTLYTPLKLKEVNIMDLVNNSRNVEYIRTFSIRMTFRHLFDHYFFLIAPQLLNENQRPNFDRACREGIDLNLPELKVMANRPIHSYIEYFLAHIKNDIELLRRDLRLNSTADIFDWLRAILSQTVERILPMNSIQVVPVDQLTPPNAVINNPRDVLIKQDENMAKQKRIEETGCSGVAKFLVNKRIKEEHLKFMQPAQIEQTMALYRILRHNYLEAKDIDHEFERYVQVSSSQLLIPVYRYKDLLPKFYDILETNTAIARYISSQYSMKFTKEKVRNVTIRSLNDNELSDKLDRFIRLWTEDMPKYESQFPEIFSFAFMCQQNLDVFEWIKNIVNLKDESTIHNFMFISRDDDDSNDIIYIKAIVRSLIDNFHNKLVKLANKVLTGEEEVVHNQRAGDRRSKDDDEAIFLGQCKRENVVGAVPIDEVIRANYFFESDCNKETNLLFDMERIEYLLAKAIKRPIIRFDDGDIKYYGFKNSQTVLKEENLKNLIKCIEPGTKLPPKVKDDTEKLSQEDLLRLDSFITDLGEHIYLNFEYKQLDEKLLKFVPPEMPVPTGINLGIVKLNHLPDLKKIIVKAKTSSLISNQTDDIDPVIEKILIGLHVDMLTELIQEMQEYIEGYGIDKVSDMQLSDFISVPGIPDAVGPLKFGQLGSVSKILEEKKEAREQRPSTPERTKEQTVKDVPQVTSASQNRSNIPPTNLGTHSLLSATNPQPATNFLTQQQPTRFVQTAQMAQTPQPGLFSTQNHPYIPQYNPPQQPQFQPSATSFSTFQQPMHAPFQPQQQAFGVQQSMSVFSPVTSMPSSQQPQQPQQPKKGPTNPFDDDEPTESTNPFD
jgi:hypothetical protein